MSPKYNIESDSFWSFEMDRFDPYCEIVFYFYENANKADSEYLYSVAFNGDDIYTDQVYIMTSRSTSKELEALIYILNGARAFSFKIKPLLIGNSVSLDGIMIYPMGNLIANENESKKLHSFAEELPRPDKLKKYFLGWNEYLDKNIKSPLYKSIIEVPLGTTNLFSKWSI